MEAEHQNTEHTSVKPPQRTAVTLTLTVRCILGYSNSITNPHLTTKYLRRNQISPPVNVRILPAHACPIWVPPKRTGSQTGAA